VVRVNLTSPPLDRSELRSSREEGEKGQLPSRSPRGTFISFIAVQERVNKGIFLTLLCTVQANESLSKEKLEEYKDIFSFFDRCFVVTSAYSAVRTLLLHVWVHVGDSAEVK
jgi:hypothetical protein